MKIAVLSGKGGTGKTFVSVNLAAAAKKATYIDCDVEEPNGHLFLNPEKLKKQSVTIRIPTFDAEKCTGCRKCIDFCRFNALVYVNDKPMVFSEVCHSCGGCSLVCSENAVIESEKVGRGYRDWRKRRDARSHRLDGTGRSLRYSHHQGSPGVRSTAG
jgi:MinD superfamily P-loop ATPase containing an inserted ferredoxin domain